MIDVKELRIGNFVVLRSNESEFLTVDIDLLVKISRHPVFFDPILLTEKLILKFGFKKVKAHDDFYWFILNLSDDENNFLPFFMYDPKDKMTTLVECVSEANILVIHYAHELQNLYFALTSKELELINN